MVKRNIDMERQEEQLVERVLGKDFLKEAKEYGRQMRVACAMQGASENVQNAMQRIAEVAYAKGAESYKRNMWHELARRYPKLDAWMLFRGESGICFFGKIVKKNGRLVSIGEDGKQTEKITHWMEVPNVEDTN